MYSFNLIRVILEKIYVSKVNRKIDGKFVKTVKIISPQNQSTSKN